MRKHKKNKKKFLSNRNKIRINYNAAEFFCNLHYIVCYNLSKSRFAFGLEFYGSLLMPVSFLVRNKCHIASQSRNCAIKQGFM